MESQKFLLRRTIAFIFFVLLCIDLVFSAHASSIWKNPLGKEVLSNGLTLVYHIDESSAITVINILIKGGKGAEPEGKKGLAYLTTRLTLEIPDQGKVRDIMNQATRINMTCRNDFSVVSIACLSENLEDTLKLMTKIMLDPLFSGLRIDGIKKQMNHWRELEEDDAINVAHNAVLDAFFKGLPYAGSVYGSEDSLKAIKKKDIENFYKNFFRAENMVIAVISDLKEDVVVELMNKYFEEFPSGESPDANSKIVSLKPPEKKIFLEKDTQQSLVFFAFPLPKTSFKNYILAFLVENLIGKGIDSRLWNLRVKEKLAYNVNARAAQLKEGGLLEAYLETDNTKKEIAVEALKKVLTDLYMSGITEEEVEVTKIHSKSFFLRNNETKEARTQTLASFEALDFGYDFINKFFLEIDSVSLEEINAFIKEVLDPEKGVEVVVGPNESKNSNLKS